MTDRPNTTRTRVKFCGLTRQEDVNAAVNAGADAIGFVLYEASPRYVSAEQAKRLAQSIPPYITPVLLFVNPSATQVDSALTLLPQALLQFHGDETPEQCWALSHQGQQPYVRAARIPLEPQAGQAPFDLVEYAHQFSQAQAILLDAHVSGYGGGGQAFNWSLLPTNVTSHLVLSGGLTPSNVIDGIRALRSRGLSLAVDVSSGIETSGPDGKPLRGIKDAEKMHRFMAAVAQADAQARVPASAPANKEEK
ncbi:phosphoribosylanthranilate isomerase [Lampropedia puyangensis]|uniref:N-(5'-phosphoribosyl)anthranilate isomerase n=1 Tax=Lampropedia puyangensis TaxID=1330072 RepID=A0A4S8F9F7_9BURK|nr:phosphoribosylanthranilate isomerase [Lampropedia puyangensis]THU04120.1 phosphoribosylanthranilate isomerase [Lampropedia puyangensis]